MESRVAQKPRSGVGQASLRESMVVLKSDCISLEKVRRVSGARLCFREEEFSAQ